MSDTILLLALKEDDFGPLAPIVKSATWAVLAAGTLFLLFRGHRRTKWEPADTEVPQLAERTGIAVGAIVTIIVFALLNSRAFISVLAGAAGVSGLLLIIAFFWFLSLSGRYLHEAPHEALGNEHVTQRIIGDENHLTPAAEERRKRGTSLRDLIWGCGQNFDVVFDRRWRGILKIRFQMAYFLLVLCIIVALACGGQLLAVAVGSKPTLSERPGIPATQAGD